MLSQSDIHFLKDLSKNNNREWFEKNRARYESAKSGFEALTSLIIKRFSKYDDSIAHLEPKECLFRINRDVRFSKDKSPYKTNLAMYMSKGGKKSRFAGYYLHVQPGKSFVAGGLWMPEAPDLRKVRQEIDYNWDGFKAIFDSKKFKASFGELESSKEYTLSRPPKGYEPDNPAIHFLKMKSFIASSKISDADLLKADLPSKVSGLFQILKPLVAFCNDALAD